MTKYVFDSLERRKYCRIKCRSKYRIRGRELDLWMMTKSYSSRHEITQAIKKVLDQNSDSVDITKIVIFQEWA